MYDWAGGAFTGFMIGAAIMVILGIIFLPNDTMKRQVICEYKGGEYVDNDTYDCIINDRVIHIDLSNGR